MKEIIPLKKDIIFKTVIGKITNINLDHDYKIKDDIVEGSVTIYGNYKMTEASVLEEDYSYKFPFSIAISKRIKNDTIKIEIDDFRYEIDKDVMKVNIDLELSCEEVEEKVDKNEIINLDEETVEYNNENKLEEYFDNDTNIENDLNIQNEKTNINIEENINNITNNIINNDTKYYTYKIYIVRQGDTIESICSKYNVNINDLKEYNNINNLNIGDKIIIPQINE